jgi:hypothetical protein
MMVTFGGNILGRALVMSSRYLSVLVLITLAGIVNQDATKGLVFGMFLAFLAGVVAAWPNQQMRP